MCLPSHKPPNKAMNPEIFADSIGNISIIGGVVRIDLISLSATERDADNQPVPVFRQRVIMPLDGFARAFGIQEDLVKKMVRDGVLSVRAAPPSDSPAATANPPCPTFEKGGTTKQEAANSGKPRSPNFE